MTAVLGVLVVGAIGIAVAGQAGTLLRYLDARRARPAADRGGSQ